MQNMWRSLSSLWNLKQKLGNFPTSMGFNLNTSGCPNSWLNIILGVTVRMSLILAFESVDWVSRLPSPIGLSQSTEGLTRLSQREFALSACLQTGTLGSFPAFRFRLGLVHLVVRPVDLDWNCTFSSPGSPACWLQTLCLLSLYDYVSQFFMISLSHIYMISLCLLLVLTKQLLNI